MEASAGSASLSGPPPDPVALAQKRTAILRKLSPMSADEKAAYLKAHSEDAAALAPQP